MAEYALVIAVVAAVAVAAAEAIGPLVQARIQTAAGTVEAAGASGP